MIIKPDNINTVLREIMSVESISVRKLSELSGVPASAIQDVRTGKRSKVSFMAIHDIFKALGYDITLSKK